MGIKFATQASSAVRRSRPRWDAVIVAAGASRRMGGGLPKPFRRLGPRSVLAWVLEAFSRTEGLGRLIVVSMEPCLERARRLARRYHPECRVVPGGERRQDSVFAGLRALDTDSDLVVIHDAARPFVRPGLIQRVVHSARRWGAALAAAPVVDTIKQTDGELVSRTLDRRSLMAAQTPQAFRFEIVWEALRRAAADGVEGTDEAQLVERLGLEVRLVENRDFNLKLTTPEDFRMARALVRVLEARP